MKTHLVILFCAVFFLSCGDGKANETNTVSDTTSPAQAAHSYDTTLSRGRVIESILCLADASQGYALYLPSYYTAARAFPVIYFFDAHARGALPLRLYKSLAEQYGFIMVGSDVSKNGTPWQVTDNIVKTLMQDVSTRINTDPERIYTAGFSGGSRVASTVAAQQGGITGVIACAAGLSAMPQQNKFSYFGIVGQYDFNTIEMVQQDGALAQQGFTHQLLATAGKHDWPVLQDFKTALLWLQVCAIKQHLQPVNDTLAAALKSDYGNRITKAKAASNYIKMHELLESMITTFAGAADIDAYKQQLTDLTNNNNYKAALTLHNKLMQDEQALQQQLGHEFTSHDVPWWTAKISELRQSAQRAKTKQEELMCLRLINYLGLVGYLTTDHALKTNDLQHAADYLQVFRLADPQNPDCSYLKAIWFIKSGNTKDAIASLNDAASAGYSDVQQLLVEPAFVSLHNDAAFMAVLKKITGNYNARE